MCFVVHDTDNKIISYIVETSSEEKKYTVLLKIDCLCPRKINDKQKDAFFLANYSIKINKDFRFCPIGLV